MNKTRLVLCAALVAAAPAASAATFTVTNLADNGAGSLRDAIAKANQSAGADTIAFQAGLTGTITLASGELAVTDSLTIAGPGASKITIDANNASRAIRLDSANPQDKAYALSGLTIKRGKTTTVRDNDSGGGVFFELAASSSASPPITLSDMVFADNTAEYKGGAISVNGAKLTLRNVEVRGNNASSTSAGSQSRGGGLNFSRGTVTIERSRFVDNSTSGSAGAINLESPAVSAVIVDTLLQGNQATLRGGGMTAGTMTSLQVSRSAFVDNVLNSQTEGGGIYFAGQTDAGAPVSIIENSTFSGNVSQHQSGRGSALAVSQGRLIVRNSTFAFNETSHDTAPGANAGGALWVASGNTTAVTVQSTLFAGNTHGNAGQELDLTRSITSSNQSTLEVDHSSFIAMPAIGVVTTSGVGNIEVDPLLLPLTLADGGATPVHPIPANSPVIDAGANPANLTTDQRGAGFARTIDFNPCHRPLVNVTDIGAYEYRGDTIFCYGFEN